MSSPIAAPAGASCEAPTVDEPAFRTLLYRYFFFAWLYRDVGQGNALQRASAWRYNREHAGWLVTYMRRWLGCGLILCSIGVLIERLLDAPGLSAIFYVPGVISVPINAVIATTWLGLKTLPGPF